MNKSKFILTVLLAVVSLSTLHAASCKRYGHSTNQYHSTYHKKALFDGLGKKSSVNGIPKSKIVNGHIKKTRKGYTYVNPYAKSK